MSILLLAYACLTSRFCDLETTPNDTYVEMRWKADKQAPLNMVRRSEKEYPTTLDEGSLVYLGNGTELTGVMADRNLENGKTYYYTIFSLDREMNIVSAAKAEATPVAKGQQNIVQNGNFRLGLSSWSGSKVPVKLGPFGNYVDMGPNTHLSQKLTGLKPKTLYTCSVKFYTDKHGLTPTFLVSGDIQNPEQKEGQIGWSHIDATMLGKWVEKRFVFWTTEKPRQVTLTLSVAKSSLPADIKYSDVQIVQGVMSYYNPKPTPPILGQNMVLNSDFSGSPPTPWTFSNAEVYNVVHRVPVTNPARYIQLNPSETASASVQQVLPYLLVNNQTYQMIYWAKVDAGKTAHMYILNNNETLLAEEIEGDGQWHHYIPSFTTPESGPVEPKLLFSAYKEQGTSWSAQFKMPVIPATGRESVPKSPPPPKPNFECGAYTFSSLDGWHVLKRQNSYPKNIALEEGVMKITAYGNAAPSALQQQSAIVLTDKYYGSGKYSVWMKIGNVYTAMGAVDSRFKETGPTGCSFAMLPYYHTNCENTPLPYAFDKPNPMQNAKVGMEIPHDLPKMQKHYFADGNWHKYTIEWNSGAEMGDGNRTPGFVKWYVDDKLCNSFYGASYGFDNIPNRCTRFSLGAFFPDATASNANWYRAEFFVKDVTIEPSEGPNRDQWIAETSSDFTWE